MTPPVQKPVLVAEDEDSDAMILRIAFERAGLSNPLVRVSDGQEAVDYLTGIGSFADRATHPLPALLLLDLKMPRMNGTKATRAIKHICPSVPVIVLTGYCERAQEVLDCGASKILSKPMGLAELEREVREAVGHSAQ